MSKKTLFISYSHNDTTEVRKIAEAIQQTDLAEVWYDSKLRGGENYFSVIANQIVACEYLTFIVSEHSVRSDWCLRELEFAASEQKKILAVWLEDVQIPPRVKLIIQSTQYIRYQPTAMDAFIRDLSRALNGTAGTGPAPAKEAPAERDILWNEKKYFIETEKLQKIEELLREEKQGHFSVCFQPENAVLLGLAYELGLKTEVQTRKAEFYYKVARHYGSADGRYLYAALKFAKEPLEVSWLDEFDQAMQEQSPFALTYVGDDYYYGRKGRSKDMDKAYACWKTAAELGSVTAMYYMAFGYRRGECVEKDVDLAYMYALKATEFEFPRAYRILAFMYEDGEPMEQDYDAAVAMYDEAIKRGDFLSYCYKGYVVGKQGDIPGKRECYETAYKLAEEGKINSGTPYYRLGCLYEFGEGVEQDIKRSLELFFISADKGHKNAIKYMVSTIKKLDQSEWKPYLERAMELHCPDAAYELGMLEKRKDPQAQLTPEGVHYFEIGAQEGDLDCVVELIRNYSYILGRGEKDKDHDTSIRWFQFFFANMTPEYKKTLSEREMLDAYYYSFAIELDYDGPNLKPDREFVQYYIKKCLDESPRFLPKVVSFVVDGYLFPEESHSGFTKDVPHAEEMLPFLEGYLPAYARYIEKAKEEDETDYTVQMHKAIKRGYQEISDCYRTGRGVVKDREKASRYKLKATQ